MIIKNLILTITYCALFFTTNQANAIDDYYKKQIIEGLQFYTCIVLNMGIGASVENITNYTDTPKPIGHCIGVMFTIAFNALLKKSIDKANETPMEYRGIYKQDFPYDPITHIATATIGYIAGLTAHTMTTRNNQLWSKY